MRGQTACRAIRTVMAEGQQEPRGGAQAPRRGKGPRRARGGPGSGRGPQLYAALDLGTNNCRLLVAQRAPDGFRVVDSFSRIVRLGEGLVSTGELSPAAMARAHEALEVIAGKLARRPVHKARFVATQACRAARNGSAFLAEVEARTGIRFETISPREEAHLAVAGCANLIDPAARGALVVDIGGGSTELSFALRDPASGQVRVQAWTSLPIGVVTLADRFPEPDLAAGACPHWYRAMVDEALGLVRGFHREGPLARLFREGRAHVIGTSGAVTSLAGVHLGLERYNRALVDGLWIGADQTLAAIARLRARSKAGRAAEPCIGADRADLVLAGAAILEAVLQTWPGERLRVADRGLREGLILSMLEGRRQAAPVRGNRGGARQRRGSRPQKAASPAEPNETP
jgi:exopolyphosphatase / guanosine-5'-triphosphate,3'-diphosphate pyrophosphatase